MLKKITSNARSGIAAVLLLTTAGCVGIVTDANLTLGARLDKAVAAAVEIQINADLTDTSPFGASERALDEVVEAVRAAMPGSTLTAKQVDNVRRIARSFAAHGDGDPRSLAYILATAVHESRLLPVRETFAATDEGAVKSLDAWAAKTGRKGPRYWARDANGHAYYGRGFVQLTHRENYIRMGKALGVDLVSDPDRVMQPDLAADILVLGMVRGLFVPAAGPLLPYLARDDLKGARSTVNRNDKWDLIAGYYRAILGELSYNE